MKPARGEAKNILKATRALALFAFRTMLSIHPRSSELQIKHRQLLPQIANGMFQRIALALHLSEIAEQI